MRPVSLLASLIVAAASSIAAADCSRDSAAAPVALVELYTSEGCNSCPPTDTWISALGRSAFAGDRPVVLAFHVDYWDGLGWRDRFGSATFTERQRTLARRNRSGLVYTPQVLVNGTDFPQRGDRRALDRAIAAAPAQPKATLRIDVHPTSTAGADVALDVSVRDAQNSDDLQAYLAIYQSGLSSDVRGGENRGVHLAHDYVVRSLIGPIALDAQGRLATTRHVDLPAEARPGQFGIAAFVERNSRAEVLQAIAIPWCDR